MPGLRRLRIGMAAWGAKWLHPKRSRTAIRHRDANDTASRIRPNRILLLRLDSLGDFILSLGAFRYFRASFPDSSLEVLVRPAMVEFAGLPGLFDVVHAFDFRDGSDGRPKPSDDDLANELKHLGSFDLLVDMRHYGSTRRVAAAIPARWKGGFEARRKDECLDLILPTFDSLPQGRRLHISHRDMALAVAVCETFGTGPQGDLPGDFLKEGHLPRSRTDEPPLVIINPFSGRLIKNWPAAHYQTLIGALQGRYFARIAILGDSPGLDPQNRRALATLPGIIDLGPTLPIKEVIERLTEADLYIGNDSGTTHLAAQLGVPTIALMSGDVDVETWRPLGTATVILKGDVPCAPCYLSILSRCPAGHLCMTAIGPDAVLAAVAELLKSRHPTDQGAPSSPFTDNIHGQCPESGEVAA